MDVICLAERGNPHLSPSQPARAALSARLVGPGNEFGPKGGDGALFQPPLAELKGDEQQTMTNCAISLG